MAAAVAEQWLREFQEALEAADWCWVLAWRREAWKRMKGWKPWIAYDFGWGWC